MRRLLLISSLLFCGVVAAQDKPRGGTVKPEDFSSSKDRYPGLPFDHIKLKVWEKEGTILTVDIDEDGLLVAGKTKKFMNEETCVEKTIQVMAKTHASHYEIAVTAYLCSISGYKSLPNEICSISSAPVGPRYELTILGASPTDRFKTFDGCLNHPTEDARRLDHLIRHLIEMRDSILKD